jgi:hypothetical protein
VIGSAGPSYRDQSQTAKKIHRRRDAEPKDGWPVSPTKQWIAAYDASGSEADNQRPIAVAGLLSTDRRWRRFDRSWHRVLAEFEVPYLHMREFTASRGPFAVGWQGDERKRSAFLGSLARVIKLWVNKVWVSYIPQTIFHDADGSFTLTEGIGGPYSLAAMLCSGMIMDWLMEHHSWDDKVMHLFAGGDVGQPAFVRSAGKARVAPFIWPSRGSKGARVVTPLQAADFVAYEFATEFIRSDQEPRTRPQRASLLHLSTHIPYLAREATLEGLLAFCSAHPHLVSPRKSMRT